ncbi:MAG: thiamine pyrophosphate-binding protein [Verrucomicrobiota bacterium]|nr:thiamine pyrophosphate-binding protein [Verrucomicrobiota bacterium]
MKLSDYVLDFVRAQGVQDVFLLAGGGAMHLNDSLGKSGLNYICNLHEQACAIAGEAYAKYDTRLGVVMITVGPGATNTITGLAGAFMDSTPMLFLSGQVKRADLKGDSGVRNRGVQEVDIVTIVQSITKYAVTVTDPMTIRFHLEKAVHLAMNGRPGPVWIDIPLDVQASQIDVEKLEGFTPDQSSRGLSSEALKKKVAQVIELLGAAERPYLLFGNGVRLATAQNEMQQVIEALQMPFGLTWLAMDLAPSDHPLMVGRPGPMAPRGANFALQNCDFLLTIGARMDLVMVAFAPERLARAARKVMVDIDEKEIAKMERFLEVAICADARDFLRELLAQLPAMKRPNRDAWQQRCAEWRSKYPLVLSEHRDRDEPVSMFYFTEILCEEMGEDDLLVSGSSGNAIETLLLAFRPKKHQRVIFTTALGAMGFGLPASIGGCIAHGKRRTICVDGDGGFQMNIQELETVARLQLPIKFFVVNNNGYGSIVASQKLYFGRLVGADPSSNLTLPNITRVAAAYDLATHRITDQRNLRAELREILDAPGPMVCEVMMVPDEPRQPRVSSMQKPDGTMVSKPLEDMFPFLEREEFLANMIVPPVEE